eukprot:2303201-Alexandrium_andersonii.AAC.1
MWETFPRRSSPETVSGSLTATPTSDAEWARLREERLQHYVAEMSQSAMIKEAAKLPAVSVQIPLASSGSADLRSCFGTWSNDERQTFCTA